MLISAFAQQLFPLLSLLGQLALEGFQGSRQIAGFLLGRQAKVLFLLRPGASFRERLRNPLQLPIS